MSDRPALARRVLGLIDLTSLNESDTDDTIEALCRDAVTEHGPVASVCVYPRFVPHAHRLLSGTPVPVCAVSNFPEGENDPDRAVADALEIVDAGGTEVDVVIPWRTLAAGTDDAARYVVSSVRHAIGPDVILKAILESGELDDDDLIAKAGHESIEGGADFLKTSTGKTERSATLRAAAVMLDVVRGHQRSRPLGVKISGGVRTLDEAATYLELADEAMGPGWVGRETFRFGASKLLGDVLGALD